jgi:RimJ/RimL family protein N-acetyltransferase
MLPAPALTIRELAPSDADALLIFYRSLSDAVARTFLPVGIVSADTIHAHLDLVRNRTAISLGLLDDAGNIMGHAFIQELGTSRPMLGIGLRDAVIGQGHGRRLLERLLDDADAREVGVVALNVVKTNLRAENLYASVGFVRIGQATFRTRNDSWAMERVQPKAPRR